jgi:hypothetical protein
MKLTFQQDDDTQPKPDTRSDRRSGFWRARAQLSQAVGGVLSSSLGALTGRRTQGALPSPSSSPPRAERATAAGQHGLRLREVLERDRALVASQPLPSEPLERGPERAGTPQREAREAGRGETPQPWHPQPESAEPADLEQDSTEQERITQEFAAQDVLAAEQAFAAEGAFEAEEAAFEAEAEEVFEAEAEEVFEAEEVLVPRADAIAQAIADAIAETDQHEEQQPLALAAQPIRLEPLVAASSVTVVAPKKPASCQEPIRTRTMAKLLAAQGHRERALSIYDHLLSKDASDPALLAEADALRCAVD